MKLLLITKDKFQELGRKIERLAECETKMNMNENET